MPAVLESVHQRPVRNNLASRVTLEELQLAIRHMSNGKAAGASCIIPELVKAGGNVFTNSLLVLLHSVWDSERVPQEWVDSILVPVPKKGDLSLCDNWRGIASLDVVGKLVARVIQSRLQLVADDVLPGSQCGFRSGRGCTDMTFSARQIEEMFEHHDKAFFVFVDLTKAYDSVPRDGLWIVLARLGVPSKLVNLIRSYHTTMSAHLRLDGDLPDPIAVDNGLCQGCTMAPVLLTSTCVR